MVGRDLETILCYNSPNGQREPPWIWLSACVLHPFFQSICTDLNLLPLGVAEIKIWPDNRSCFKAGEGVAATFHAPLCDGQW